MPVLKQFRVFTFPHRFWDGTEIARRHIGWASRLERSAVMLPSNSAESRYRAGTGRGIRGWLRPQNPPFRNVARNDRWFYGPRCRRGSMCWKPSFKRRRFGRPQPPRYCRLSFLAGRRCAGVRRDLEKDAISVAARRALAEAAPDTETRESARTTDRDRRKTPFVTASAPRG